MMEKSWIEVKICFYFLRISCEGKPFVKSVKLNVTSLRSQSTWESISLISSIKAVNVMLLDTMFLTTCNECNQWLRLVFLLPQIMEDRSTNYII